MKHLPGQGTTSNGNQVFSQEEVSYKTRDKTKMWRTTSHECQQEDKDVTANLLIVKETVCPE